MRQANLKVLKGQLCWVMLPVLCALVACAELSPTAPTVSPDDVRRSVTPAIAEILSADGEFVFSEVAMRAGEISGARARELAHAYWRTFERSTRHMASGQRGVPLAASLSVCPRVFYAPSAYEEFPSELPQEFRRAFGAQWLAGLCHGSEQQVAISIAAGAIDLRLLEDGRIGNARSGDFFMLGVVPGATVPATPELGAVVTARKFGSRVAEVPVLRRPASRLSALDSKWVYRLDRPTDVIGDDSRVVRRSRELTFGFYKGIRNLQVLDENPVFAGTPRQEQVQVPTSGSMMLDFVLTRRADVPARWEVVTKRER